MRAIDRLNKSAFLLAVANFLLVLFFSALNVGLAVGENALEIANSKSNILLSGKASNFEDSALRYLLISLLILINLVLLRPKNKLIPKVIGLVSLFLIILQYRILILSKPANLPAWMTEYSGWLSLTWYADFFFLALALSLAFLQFGGVWMIYASSVRRPS